MKTFLALLLTFSFDALSQTITVDSLLKYRMGFPNFKDSLFLPTGNRSFPHQTSIWMGTLNSDSNPTYEFKVLNDATTPFIVTNAYWGEPIVEPMCPREPAPPGGTTIFRFRCHTRYQVGTISKQSTIYSNSAKEPVMSFYFKGNILPQHLHLNHNAAFLQWKPQLDTSFTITHKWTDWDTTGFVVDSIVTDEFTTVSCDTMAVGPKGSIRFRVSCKAPEKAPQVCRVKVFIGHHVAEYDVFIIDREKKSTVKAKSEKRT